MSVALLIIGIAIICFAAERALPGRALPISQGWYFRASILNLCQSGVVMLAGVSWNIWLRELSILDISQRLSAPAQGFLAWFIGTFVFYWWHRARHDSKFLWRSLHQIHHSASRIEMLTAFYKHPIEMASNSIIISFMLFTVLGASLEAAAWFNLFAASGELFYHSNLKTPHWVGYVMQRPEHHSIHHQFNVHKFNFGDITWWDRLFGTFQDTDKFAPRCGFKEGSEQSVGKMLLFKDVY
ncbi:sterol desaturase family protein [Candidatus Methylospira mobilis]|uniref:Sterol desaturase family protein n=2 Tax=Candidatus Methylospira mobilis TaxID=1808979 RepID=A0A5Q0BSF0_9GAMM|nr:sterol desaturase family protein [Candidatus Methylospira mobilis]